MKYKIGEVASSSAPVPLTVNNAATTTRKNKAPLRKITSPTFNIKMIKDIHDNEEKSVEIINEDLKLFLRNNLNFESMYDETPIISVDELYSQLEILKFRASRFNSAISKELIAFLESENHQMIFRTKTLLETNQVSFMVLRHVFTPGLEIEIHESGLTYGGKVVDTKYIRSFFGTYFEITYDFISNDGESFVHKQSTVEIGQWQGVKSLSSLNVLPLKNDTKEMLTNLGKVYQTIGIGAHYKSYEGMMQVKRWWKWDKTKADGRIMIDPIAYNQFVDTNDYSGRRSEDQQVINVFPEVSYWMTDPYVYGFSFSNKQWGKFVVAQLSDIQFRDEAFNQLVLEENKKELIKALVMNNGAGFQDVISGKGGGCIFLLHGVPGVGKTLSAEAIAELLHRPLYSVSVGELGVNADELEKNLRQILDVAQMWNAVILIDEADIFLEKRTSGDILRNAMVGIFLRLLEYHQGVLFLTTNRVVEFDEAFHSRISVALKYKSLDKDARLTIWNNLLDAANIDKSGIDVKRLAKIAINGRQIKNTIRLAQGLAKQQNTSINAEHIMLTIEIAQQFKKDLGKEN